MLKQAKSNIFLNGKNSDGFTMIELLIVVVLIGIVVSLTFGNLGGLIANSRAKTNARELMSNFNNAKLAAIKNKKDCLVVLTYTGGGNDGGAVACFDNNNDNLCKKADDQIIFSFQLDGKSSVKLENISFTDNKFKFNSRGISNLASPSKVKFSNDSGYEISIEVSPVGRIKIN